MYNIPAYHVVVETAPNTFKRYFTSYYLELAQMYLTSLPVDGLIIIKMYDMHSYTKLTGT